MSARRAAMLSCVSNLSFAKAVPKVGGRQVPQSVRHGSQAAVSTLADWPGRI